MNLTNVINSFWAPFLHPILYLGTATPIFFPKISNEKKKKVTDLLTE